MTGITTVLVLSSVISVLVIIVYAGSQSRKRYKKENTELRDEIKNATARPEHIREHDEKNKIVTEEAVVFDERDGGLWLSYENYRALERNVIVLREYAAWLLLIAEYYREEWYVDNGLLFSILGAIVSAGGGKGAVQGTVRSNQCSRGAHSGA